MRILALFLICLLALSEAQHAFGYHQPSYVRRMLGTTNSDSGSQSSVPKIGSKQNSTANNQSVTARPESPTALTSQRSIPQSFDSKNIATTTLRSSSVPVTSGLVANRFSSSGLTAEAIPASRRFAENGLPVQRFAGTVYPAERVSEVPHTHLQVVPGKATEAIHVSEKVPVKIEEAIRSPLKVSEVPFSVSRGVSPIIESKVSHVSVNQRPQTPEIKRVVPQVIGVERIINENFMEAPKVSESILIPEVNKFHGANALRTINNPIPVKDSIRSETQSLKPVIQNAGLPVIRSRPLITQSSSRSAMNYPVLSQPSNVQQQVSKSKVTSPTKEQSTENAQKFSSLSSTAKTTPTYPKAQQIQKYPNFRKSSNQIASESNSQDQTSDSSVEVSSSQTYSEGQNGEIQQGSSQVSESSQLSFESASPSSQETFGSSYMQSYNMLNIFHS